MLLNEAKGDLNSIADGIRKNLKPVNMLWRKTKDPHDADDLNRAYRALEKAVKYIESIRDKAIGTK
jgi:hypothetical protein